MNKVILFFAALLFCFNLSAQKYSDSTFVIGEGHVGKVLINMDEKKLSSLYEPSQIKADKKSAEGDEYAVINITLPGESKTGIEIETMCMDICLVSRITVYSPKYKTVKGISVGSNVSDLKKSYTISSVIGGEKGIMIYIEEIPQTAFVVDVPKIKASAGKTINIAEIPDLTKIQWVYMY